MPDALGRTHVDGYGISHIAAKHPKDLHALPEVIARGRVLPHDSSDAGKRYIVHGNRVAIIKRKNSANAFVVSGLADPKKIATLKTKSQPSWMVGK